MGSYAVNKDACMGCGACMSVCPMGAVSEAGGAYLIDATKCIGCGACANLCIAGAISAN